MPKILFMVKKELDKFKKQLYEVCPIYLKCKYKIYQETVNKIKI